VASRCAELGATKAALTKRVHAAEAERADGERALAGSRASLDACDKERETAQDEVVRLTDIASAQHDELLLRTAELDRKTAELAALQSALTGKDDEISTLKESFIKLEGELETARQSLAAEKQEGAETRAAERAAADVVAAHLTEALALQQELEETLKLCIQQRDRAMAVAASSQAALSRLNKPRMWAPSPAPPPSSVSTSSSSTKPQAKRNRAGNVEELVYQS
jgi:chromosome segregation ATPase